MFEKLQNATVLVRKGSMHPKDTESELEPDVSKISTSDSAHGPQSHLIVLR